MITDSENYYLTNFWFIGQFLAPIRHEILQL